MINIKLLIGFYEILIFIVIRFKEELNSLSFLLYVFFIIYSYFVFLVKLLIKYK
jgi:hypothetical protein